MSEAQRIRILKCTVAAGLIGGFGLTWRLWFGPREFPAAPLFGFDQMRLQPWLYLEAFLLLALFLVRRPSDALAACRIAVAGTYLWSGLQKLNGAYMDQVFPWLVDDPGASALAAAASALAEAGIGLALLHPMTRGLAAAGAVGMHGFILLALVSLGWNTAVIPWNMMMMAIVPLLAFGTQDGGLDALLPRIAAPAQAVAWLLFVALPALSPLGAWDSYLSASLYTGATSQAQLFVPAVQAGRLPPSARAVAAPVEGGVRVSLLSWSLQDLNVPVYPEPRVFRGVARTVCADLGSPEGMRLVIRHRFTALHPARIETLSCADLARN